MDQSVAGVEMMTAVFSLRCQRQWNSLAVGSHGVGMGWPRFIVGMMWQQRWWSTSVITCRSASGGRACQASGEGDKGCNELSRVEGDSE